MDVFFDLPEVQQAAVLTEWLEFDSFLRFYFAVVNKQRRSELRALLASDQCIFRFDDLVEQVGFDVYEEDCDSKTTKVFEWIICSGIKFDDFALKGFFFQSSQHRRRLLSHLSSTLHTLRMDMSIVERDFDSYRAPKVGLASLFSDILELCPKLKHVEFAQQYESLCHSAPKLFAAINDFLVTHAHMQSVMLNSFQKLPGYFVVALSNLQSLQTVQFHECYFSKKAVDIEHDTERNTVHTLHLRKFVGVCALFPNITLIQMSELSCKDVELLVEYCPHVRTADLRFDRDIFDIRVLSEGAVTAMGTYWRNITVLMISSSGISEKLVVKLIEKCPSLTHLNTINTAMKAAAEANYPTHCAGSKLVFLYTTCDNADTLQSIVALCPNLHTLKIEPRPGFEMQDLSVSQALFYITKECSIKHLALNNYGLLSNDNILQLQYTNLEILAIYRATELTSAGILKLLPTMPYLQNMIIVNCRQVQHNVLLHMPILCTSLKNVTYTRTRLCSCRSNCGCEWREERDREVFLSEAMRALFPHITFDIHIG